MPSFIERLQSLRQAPNHGHIAQITRGLEKESLRVTPEGRLASSPHPKSLGSALTHSRITTDFSEALLEFITPPEAATNQLISTLNELHSFTYQHIGKELLWANSMPCQIGHDDKIPLAYYGSSNSGRMKTVYRQGLGHRYGRSMQTIAGIHYNFSVADEFWQFLQSDDKSILSLQDYKNQGYFHLIRNFRRYFWLLLYLFGAAPAVCKSFVKQRRHHLLPIGTDQNSLHTPFASSLRMGDLGYQSSAQESLVITYNCLQSYSDSLCQAITQTHPEYAAIGTHDHNGHYQQLNDCLLQIENEFYSLIRPKRTASSGQTALNALNAEGVEYIEVRCLDLNPFETLGISEQQIRFLDVFLLYCLLEDSPLSDEGEYQQQQENQRRMVYQGRKPELKLYHFGEERNARDWGKSLFQQLRAVAQLLDEEHEHNLYSESLSQELKKLDDDRLTPSAKILAEIEEQQLSFYQWSMNVALKNRDYFLAQKLTKETHQFYTHMAEQSIQQQATIETNDSKSFDTFLADYYGSV